MWVGVSLLTLLFVVVGVYLRGVITEQNLRVFRFNHHEETPLDRTGQLLVLRPDMRENPDRHNHYQPQAYYQGYQVKD